LIHLKPEDWITVTLSEAHDMGLSRKFVKKTSQLVELLQEKYPTYNWEKMFTMKGRYGQQRRLEQAVLTLFPVSIHLC